MILITRIISKNSLFQKAAQMLWVYQRLQSGM